MLTPQPDASIAADLPSVDHADIPASVPSTPALTVPSFNPIENVPELPQPTPSQPPVLPQTYRKFGDVAKTRQLIFDNVLKAASTLPPMTNTRHAMHIENVRWSGPETYSIADQKQAILSRGTLGRKLIGEVVLRNPDGTEIERRNTQLARVPYMTDRGTFIVNGNEYTMSHQMRLRPGVFTRMKQNGELESHVNVAKGYSHRIELDPATGVFKVNIGQAHIQLLPLLRAMGVPETKIREAWGNELTSANMQKEDTQAMRKLHEKLFRGKPAGEEGVNQSVVKAFNDMVLDPDVTKRTLGQGFSNVGPDTLLAITNKLLRVAKQEDEPDDRDAMAYQTLVGPEDVLAERIQKSKNILRKLFWKASGRGNLQNVASNALDDAIRAGLLTSGLGQPLSEINPAEIFDQHSRVTRMGEGGITSMDAVPDEARTVQPSQFGFIDYLRTPECYDYATEVMTRKGWKFWPDVVATDELACQVDGRLEFHVPHVLHRYMYNGEMCGVDTGRINYLVTPNHRVWVRGLFKTAKYHFELADQVKNFRKVQSGGFLPYLGDVAETFRLPHAYISHNPKQVATAANIVNVDHINVDDWAEFMGWWLGEGSTHYKESNGDGNVSYRVKVSQSLSANPENYRRIEQLLDRLPFKFYKDNDDRGFTLTGKQLTAYLKQFGGSVTRRIPEELLRARTSARQRLMDALLLAEGRRDRSGVRTQFCTTSKQLADDFQRLAFSLGFSTQYVWEPDEREQSNHGGAHIIHVHKFNEHQLHVKRPPSQGGRSDHYRQQYNDYVYCATVPGGLLYVRRQGMLGHWSGNSGKVGVDARIANATVKGDNGQIYTKVRMRDGTDAYKTPQDFADATVAFPNEMTSPDGYVAALQKGRFTMVPRDAVDFEVPNNEDVFSPLGNMIPFKSALKGQRAVMAARMMTQALPLRNAEAPLVQSGIAGEKGVSYEDRYAKHMGAVHAEQPARIIDVNDNGITLVNADGEKKTIQLYHNFPFNQKTYVHQTPMVGVGDIVKPGQLLAKSNFTDDKGTTALGLNARVAYIPWGGLNFEDANVVSESFAKRMSSEHMYQHDHEWESNDKKGLNSFRSIFPAEYDRATLSQFDEHGVIKPGTKVKQGDPLILIARAKELNKKSLLRGTKPIYQNMSQLWENSDEGVVTDVVHTPKGAAVVVKATVPMQVGDKMCFDEDTEVLTTRGWVYIADVLMTDKICTLQHGDEINYLYPTALHRYATGGRMYKIKSQQVDQFVTVNHRQYVRKRNQDTFTLERAENVYGKRVCYKKNGNWQGVSPATVMIDGFDVRAGRSGNGKRRLPDVTLSVETYLTLLGAFISEGNLVNQPKSGTYGIDITQIKQPNRSQIMDELSRLDVHFNEHNHSEKIRIHSKVLYNHFAQFGRTAKEKHLPAEIFNWAKADLQILFRWLMWGDGTVSHVDRPICYTTISPQLADDVQRLCLHIGYAANIVKDNDGGMQTIKGKEYYCQPRYSVRVVTTKLTPMVNHGHTKTQCVQEECVIENYDRPVYCVTVPGHVLYVRRNGKPCWSGNSGRFGDKGIVSHIIPDDQMMTDKDGKPFEVLLNPLGVTSRTNPAQIIEAALGKVAAMRGEAYKVPDFQNEDDMVEFALGELRKHGLDDSEQLTDPRTNRKIPDVFTGNRWIMKLHHTAESKGQGRGLGAYTAEGTPAKGGAEGAKRIGMLETNALLSHGATQFLRNSSLIRGQSNPQLWAQYMSGNKMPTVAVPHVYHKYVNNLRSAGINVVREGTRLNVMALTDKDIDQLAADREIKNAETVDWKTMEPVKGGLFDTTLTGGHATSEGGGNRWSYIKLHEPLPNPVMEEPIRRVLGLTTNKFNDIISGKERLNDKTGPTAIAEALGNINVDAELARARADIASNKKTARDAAIRRLNFLKSAQRLGIHPKDWMLSRVPVLPPAFRPVSTMGANKLPLVADANYLYKELFDANAGLKEIAKQLDPDDLGDERMAVYNAFKAVTGLGDPTHAKNQERGVKGILKHVFGSSPKLGAVQRRLLGSSTDLVGRAVIAPDPDLDMDQVGLPENQAWTIYRPVLIHKLVRKGMPRLQAARAVEERSQAARTALLDEMDNGVVVINRAPTLHRYGMMAARPRLVKGDVLKISPLVVGGFGADFDGDAMQYHLPVGDEEKQEVMEKMLPSRNLFSAATFRVQYTPSQEYIGGLYAATTNVDTKNHPLVFDTAADAIRAYRNGQIGSDRQVHILNH